MIVSKYISLSRFFNWSGKYFFWISVYVLIVFCLFYFDIFSTPLPYLPVSILGTAVAFFIGFKNNQSYDRVWEARKIWGGIVNESRTWGMMVDAYISNLFKSSEASIEELHSIKKRLIYRHIAWLYLHRSQLLVPTEWEHASQKSSEGKSSQQFQRRYGTGLVEDEVSQLSLEDYISEDDIAQLKAAKNKATQIVNQQSQDLALLRKENFIDDFRNVQLEDVLRSFYTLQGKNERIKKFPFPRQYSNLTQYFTYFFVFLLPFTLLPELTKFGPLTDFFAIITTILLGGGYIMMDVVADYSENPFQGMANDIPMLSICRTIEIDLRQMLGETDLPEPIQAKDDILM